MTRFLQILRLVHINVVLVRHGLDEVILATHLLRPIRFLLYLLPWNWVRRHHDPSHVRIRRALSDLGPLFVKFGQLLSTRGDLLPADIVSELSKLQDRVPPFPGSQARIIVEQALGSSVDAIFAQFDESPLASASIAQVHSATLLDGREVVVKVVRPGIEAVIRRDVGLLFTLANLAERYWPDASRLKPRAVVAEFETIILDELDLMREAASASLLRRNFHGTGLLYIPEIHWQYTRKHIMVLERVTGVPISDVATLEQQGIDLKVLAERGVDIFFTQVFKHNFFHADMHPGNIFVDGSNPDAPSYVAVDFGIMGSLTPDDQRYLAENILAFFNRDYFRVAELHVASEWVPSDTRIDEFESAIRSVCEPIFERPLKEISFGHLFVQLFQTARRFNMKVQPQLVLLQKTLLNIEGLGRQLYPDLDLWQTAKPFLEEWVRERLGPAAMFRELRKQAPRWGDSLPALPGLAFEVLRQARDGKLRVDANRQEIADLRREIQKTNQRTFFAVMGAAFLISATVLLVVDGPFDIAAAEVPLVTWILGLTGLCFVWAAWPRRDD